MTEGRLFAIGLAIWAYKWVLQSYLRSKLKRRIPPFAASLLHALFYASIGALLAVTIYAYLGHVRGFTKVGILGSLFGFVGGLVTGLFKASREEARRAMLAVDLEWAETASSAVILASVIMYTTVQAFKIPSGSMHPTLYEGDHLFVNKFYYGIRIPFSEKRVVRVGEVTRGDVVVFRFPSEDEMDTHYGKDFIKRAVGLPGDRVEIKKKELWINGQPVVKEPYSQFSDPRTFPEFHANSAGLKPGEYERLWREGKLASVLRSDEIRDNFGPVVVPEGHYFVMGDNRDASYDSRFWGPMPLKYLKGKAWLLYWPPKRIKIIR